MITSTGYKLPQSVISNTGWVNTDRITFADGEFAYVLSNDNRMVVGNFQLNIPQGKTISNIEVVVRGYRNSFPTTLKVWAIDDLSGLELAYPLSPDFNSFSGNNQSYVIENTLFGKVWSVDEINNIKIALEADGELHLDNIALNVSYYDSRPSDGLPVGTGNTCETIMDEFIQAQPFELARALRADDTYAILKSFQTPDKNPITIGMIGGKLSIVVEQGNGEQEEVIDITDIVHNYNGTGLVKLDFGSLSNRGLGFSFPYTSSNTRMKYHVAGSEVVISNSAKFYTKFLKDRDIGCSVSAPISVKDEGINISSYLRSLNFKGLPVTATSSPNIGGGEDVDVTITGAGGTVPPVITHSSSATTGNSKSTLLSWLHESSGIDRLLVVDVVTEVGTTVSGVTYNALPLTLHSQVQQAGSSVLTQRWITLAPTVGIHPVVVNVTPSSYITAGARSMSGVNQSAPFDGASVTQQGTGSSIVTSKTTTINGSAILDVIGTGLQPMTHTTSSGQSVDFTVVNSAMRQITGGSQATGSFGTFPANYNLITSTGFTSIVDAVRGITIGSISGTDELVKISATDTTASYLGSKIVAGSGVTLTTLNPGANEQIQINATGGGGSGTAITETVTQTAHGLVVGDWVRSSYVSGQYTKAQANTADNSAVIGLVTAVPNANTFELTKVGSATVTTGYPIGDALWLSPTTAGAMTNVEPTTIGQIRQPLGYVVGTNEIDIKIQRGDDVTVGSGGNANITSPGIERLISSNSALLKFGNYVIAQNAISNGTHKATFLDSNNTYQVIDVPKSSYTPPWGGGTPSMMYLTISEDKSKIYQTRNYSQGVGAQQALVVDEIDTNLTILNTYVYVSPPSVIQFSLGWTFVDGNNIIIAYSDTPTGIGFPFFAQQFTMSGGLLTAKTATNIVIGTNGVGSNNGYGFGYKHTDGFVYMNQSGTLPLNTVGQYTYSALTLSVALSSTSYEQNLNGVIPTQSHNGFEIDGTDVGWYANSSISPRNSFIYQIYPF